MSDQNQNDPSSFYPTGIDNSEVPSPAEEKENQAHTLFIKELYHLTHPGPFLDNEGRIALRGFSYKEVTLFGFLIEETTDAFLVLLPASLAKDEEGVKATQVIASPLARMLKSNVGIVSLPTPVQTLYYLSLIHKQLNTCPGYFTKARIRQIDNLISILKIALGVTKSVPGTESKKETTVKPIGDTFRVPDQMIPRTTH
jgi:hypothetical protein